MTITSHHNERLKEIRKLRQRRRERERSARFVAEGEDLLAAADAAGWPALERFCVAGSGLPGVEIEPSVLASVSGLASGTRALAVYQERWAPEALGPLCVYLHGVSDPGNVGAVLRSAEAFGASCVALGPGTADPFSPKAVRASMGAIFAVPLARPAAAEGIANLPGRTIALVAGSGVPLADVCAVNDAYRHQKASPPDPALARPPTTLLVGAEREGLPDAITAHADHVAHIPIATHSLNAAMAATVALYELTRMPAA
ncbi:MAG TPA: RNA methyltransferase [Solirubrobacteraceae bacterium]|jgi:TrmH family RNA methyltransferase|nr:RNA methyltransferase [Solirubrobacteraceae bacterium]